MFLDVHHIVFVFILLFSRTNDGKAELTFCRELWPVSSQLTLLIYNTKGRFNHQAQVFIYLIKILLKACFGVLNNE